MDKNISLLYVDDEEYNLLLFKLNFEGQYKVHTATSGSTALDVLEQHKDEIIIVISDMKMPEMNGVEFIRKARERHDKISYFILSGFMNNQEIEEAVQNKEIVEFLSKPIIREKLEKVIEKVAAGTD